MASRVCCRFAASASSSSKKRTLGGFDRALSKMAWSFRSDSPMYMSRMSWMATLKKVALHSPAVARASSVLPHPGGP